MADLYAKPSDFIETGYNPEQQQAGGVNKEVEEYLNSLPLEERDAARQRLMAPPTGEEIAMMVDQDETYLPTIEQFDEIEKWHKTKEVGIFDGLGTAAEMVFNEFGAAFGSATDKPLETAQKLPATVIEAFMQGTRAMYGMAAQSQNPDSAFFRVKDFLNGTGTREDRYNQYLEALDFNRKSKRLMEGKETLVMDKDLINPEVTQAMSYIADPSLFIPFGKVASAGARAVGMGEKLTLAAGRATAIKNKIIGGAIKWGAGQPLEFLGGAVRNTIDFGLEKAGDVFETATGMEAKEFARTARLSGIGVSAAGVAGHSIPYANAISDAYFTAGAGRGLGEALTAVGETMGKSPFERGINSWAREALEQANKSGTPLSKQAQGLLKALDAVDPMFAYSYAMAEGAAQGMAIGGTLGYLSGGEEGLYQGMGAGLALGTMGAGAGKVVADVTGGTGVARRAVQAKMVIEGKKVTDPETATALQALQSAAESRGKDVDFVNGIIAGIDNLAPNTVLHALTVDQFKIEAVKQGYDPDTGRFAETQNLVDLSEFGDNRQMRGRTTAFLRLLGGSFAGDADKLLRLSKDARFQTKLNERIKTQFNTLSEFEKDFVVRELKRQKSLIDSGKKKASDFRADYEAVSWGESWTAEIIKKYGTDAEGAKRDIKSILDDETVNGKLTRRGRVFKDRLRAEGFLSRNGDILSERNLHDADMTSGVFDKIKGAVVTREADGKTHLYLNLESFGDETFPHELFHAIFRDSPMKHQFVDSLAGKLLGVRDEKGNLIKEPEIAPSELKRFFKRYIEKTTYNQDGSFNREAADRMYKLVENGLAEYEATGDLKKISDSTRQLLNKYTEEFGAYYFSNWIMGKNRNYLFYGGELRGIAGIIDSVKENWLDFWQSKISSANPSFDFSKGVNEAFAKGGSVGRISAIDIWMRDMVRANANSLRGAFNPDTMSADNARQFYRSNGIRNIADSNGRPLQVNKQTAESRRLGREAFKILNGLDPTLRTTRTTLDTDGKQVITGKFSDAELDALVRGGIVPRAWADKVRQGYAMVDGTMPNVASFGYLGKTEQIGDYSWPRKTGKDVAFKNRKAIVFDVETKVRADGTFYTLFHTLDKAVIEQRGNDLWRNAEVRKLWNDDRGAMEADFFNYLNNASKASTDNTKVDSAILLEKGDGLGAKRRDAMHQMAGMALQEGDSYRHKPMAEIPQGIRHSVTTFNVDGMTTLRIDKTERYNVDMNNAHKFIRENWQPDDMKSEKTPNGMAFTHASGYKFLRTDDGKVFAYSNDGSRIGTFGSLKEATDKARSTYNKVLENTRKTAQKMQEYDRNRSTSFQPIGKDTVDEAFEKGDLFKTARIQQIVGNSKLVRQSFDEFLGQRIEEISKGKDEAERGAILSQLFNEDFKELIELEKELQKNLDEFSLEARTLQAQEQEIISRIVEFGQEKKRLQQFSDPDARVDVGILEMYERIYKRKEEVVRRMSEISNKMHNEGITDANSHYYIVKRFLEKFNETGKLSDEAIKFVLTPRLIKEYESQFQTGQPVSFVANHGTPNYELMASRTFNTEFLGRNTGSMSAFNATFFAGSKETSVNYVGNPIKMSWVRDFIDARSFFVEKLPIDVRVKIERLLESDTSKGVVQKVKLLMNNLAKEFPDDFKLVDSSQRTKDGEIIYKPSPTTQRGYYIDSLVDKILEGANDEGWAIGGYEMYWEQAGRKPNLLRTLVKMDNPYVHEYAKADYRDETFASVIQRAKEAGHDGVIFKNTKDGGGIDTIFASFAKNEDNKIFVIETTEDTRFAPRGTDESGRVYKGGSEIEGRSFQPDDYQGGDDYYKPRTNPFERKDEQGFLIREPYIRKPARTASGEKVEMNPDNVIWEDIGHFKRLSEKETGLTDKELYKWENNDVGLWAFNINTDAVVTKNKINPREVGFRYTHGEWFDEPFWSNNYSSIWGRYEKPIYDKSGNLVRRGRVSMTGQYRGSIKDMAHAKRIKNDIAKKLKVSAEDIDAYIFDASEPIKQSMGFSSRDQLPIKFQPDDYEGGVVPDIDFDALIREEKERQKNTYKGKQYTPEQMTFSFIGRYASERPDFINGLDLMYSGSGTARSLVLSDSNTGERIGHINLIADPESPNKHAYIQMSDVVRQGRGYGTLLYSELAERLRSEGYTSIDGRVVDSLGRPIKIRKSVIDTENKRLRKKGTSVVGERVSSPLFPDAKYQPDEGGRTYSEKEMAGKFIGRYAAENKGIDNGLKLFYGKVPAGMGALGLTLRDKKGEVVAHGQWQRIGDYVMDLDVKVDPKHQGKGYGNLLYSEAVERMRADGVEIVQGFIIDEKQRPVKIRQRIIDKENARIGSKKRTEMVEQIDDEAGIWESGLDKKAWYEPDDKDKAPVNWVKSGFGTEGYNMDVVWMKPSRFLNLAFPFLGDYKDKAGRPNIESLKKKMQSGSGMDRIYLRVDLKKGTKSFKVIGHEGRHRATAAMELFGDDKLIPVEIDYNSEHLKQINRGDYDYKLPEGKKLAGSISRMVKENKPMWNEKGTAKFQPDEIPKEKGTTEIKAGYTRVYHQTTPDNIESIMRKGLLVSKSRPTSESRGVSVSETPFYGDNPNLVTIELQVPTEKLRRANGSALFEDVPASNIIAVHENWHDKARYILNNPETLKEVLNGDMDFMAGDGSPEAKAIEYIKKKYSKKQPKFQPDEGGRKYTDEQFSNEFVGRFAAENPDITNGLEIEYYSNDTSDFKDVDGTKWRVVLRDKSGFEIGDISFEYEQNGGFFDGTNEINGLVVRDISVNIDDPANRGKKYQHLLYSEMFERARATGAIGFTQNIENKIGLPLKSVNRIVGKESSKIWTLRDYEPVSTTQENFDRLMSNAPKMRSGKGLHSEFVQNNGRLDPNAWYQPDETKIGTRSSNVELLLKGMREGRILRTSSYRDLGLEDSLLIAHTPDTAKIGQVTAGDKALVDLQGGIFYAVANGKKIWASNFAGEGETNSLVQYANRQLESNPNRKTYIMLVKADNDKIFNSVDGARGVSNIFKHLNDSGVMSDAKYVKALRTAAKNYLRIEGLDGLGKEELYAKIDDYLLRSKNVGISFEDRADFTRNIATQLKKSGAFSSEKSKKALIDSFHSGFERGFSKVEMEMVFGNLMAEDIIKNVPRGHIYGAIEIVSPLKETKESNHRGYDASIEQTSGEPARLIIFDKTAHSTEVLNKKSGDVIHKYKKGEGSYHSYTGGNIPYQEVRGKKQMPFQPAEWSDFKTEQSPMGKIIKNAKGYSIMLINNKYRVYNPAKAIIGVYGNEEEAKRRVLRDAPKQ